MNSLEGHNSRLLHRESNETSDECEDFIENVAPSRRDAIQTNNTPTLEAAKKRTGRSQSCVDTVDQLPQPLPTFQR